MNKLQLVPFVFVVALATFVSCSRGAAPEECVNPAPGQVEAPQEKQRLERTHFKPQRDPDEHWCQSCVVSQSAFISCQKVYGNLETKGEAKLRKDSLDKACQDAGFATGTCPESAQLSTVCKGEKIDPKQFKAAGERLKNMLPKVPNVPPGTLKSE